MVKHNQVLWRMLAFLFYRVICLGSGPKSWPAGSNASSAFKAFAVLFGPASHVQNFVVSLRPEEGSARQPTLKGAWLIRIRGTVWTRRAAEGRLGSYRMCIALFHICAKKQNSVYVPPSAWRKGLVSSKKGCRILVRGWYWKELWLLTLHFSLS